MTTAVTTTHSQAVELVPLDEARTKMNAAVAALMDGDMTAEKDVEKYDQIIRMHPDYEARACAAATIPASSWDRAARVTTHAIGESAHAGLKQCARR